MASMDKNGRRIFGTVSEPVLRFPRQHLGAGPHGFGYIAGFLGIVEPQMRLTEHRHELIQLFGFSHPRVFFEEGRILDRYREIFSFLS